MSTKFARCLHVVNLSVVIASEFATRRQLDLLSFVPDTKKRPTKRVTRYRSAANAADKTAGSVAA